MSFSGVKRRVHYVGNYALLEITHRALYFLFICFLCLLSSLERRPCTSMERILDLVSPLSEILDAEQLLSCLACFVLRTLGVAVSKCLTLDFQRCYNKTRINLGGSYLRFEMFLPSYS